MAFNNKQCTRHIEHLKGRQAPASQAKFGSSIGSKALHGNGLFKMLLVL